MVSGIIFDTDGKERDTISKTVRNGIAIRSDDESRIVECGTSDKLKRIITESDLNDFCCLEFLCEGGRECASFLRKSFPQSSMLLLVDISISPKEYVRPDILPSAILIKPSDEQSVNQTIDEFLDCVLKTTEKNDESIKIDTREGITRIPYEQISYVEASAKKIFIRTKKAEYGYYDTLDKLEKELPGFFLRCHRGYIVNLHKVKKYVGAENALYLSDGSIIPVSRSYKSSIREVLK